MAAQLRCLLVLGTSNLLAPLDAMAPTPLLPHLLTESMGLSVIHVGSMLSTMALGKLLSELLMMLLAARVSPRKLLLLMGVLRCAAGLMFVAAFHVDAAYMVPLLYASRALHGLSLGTLTLSSLWVACRLPECEYARRYKALQAATVLGMLTGPAFGCILASFLPSGLDRCERRASPFATASRSPTPERMVATAAVPVHSACACIATTAPHAHRPSPRARAPLHRWCALRAPADSVTGYFTAAGSAALVALARALFSDEEPLASPPRRSEGATGSVSRHGVRRAQSSALQSSALLQTLAHSCTLVHSLAQSGAIGRNRIAPCAHAYAFRGAQRPLPRATLQCAHMEPISPSD